MRTTRQLSFGVWFLVLCVGAPLAVAIWHKVDPQSLAAVTGAESRPTTTQSTGSRLAFPSTLAPADPSFRFLRSQTDRSGPVAFDPCRPIHYVVRPEGAPPGGAQLLTAAVGQVSAATGLQFVFDGATSEAPQGERPNFLPDLYGDRWAPVLISWSGAQEIPELGGDVIGLAASDPVLTDDNRQVLVSGRIAFDTEDLTHVIQFNGGRAVAEATIAHELGHLVGLDHVDDPGQLMYPSARPIVRTFGRGDLTGLAALGRGDCFPEL